MNTHTNTHTITHTARPLVSRAAVPGTSRARWLLVALLAAALASPPAFAQRGRGHGHGHRHGGVSFGLFVAAPLIAYSLYRPYYTPTYYYPREVYPPVVVTPPAPPVYIEQAAPPPQAAPQSPQSWWYYCADSQTYYPYVRQCPGGWQRVSPQPPA